MLIQKKNQFIKYFLFLIAFFAINACNKQTDLAFYRGMNPPRFTLNAQTISFEKLSENIVSNSYEVDIQEPLHDLLSSAFVANGQGEKLYIVIDDIRFEEKPESRKPEITSLFSAPLGTYFKITYKVRLENRDLHGFSQKSILVHSYYAKLIPAHFTISQRQDALKGICIHAANTLYEQILVDIRTQSLKWLPENE